MQITEVKVFPVNEERLKAYVTIVIDNCFVIRDLKIIKGNSGLFVAMPSKKRKDGSYKDIAHPLNQDTRTEMEELILKTYLDTIKAKPSGTSAAAAEAQADAELAPGSDPKKGA